MHISQPRLHALETALAALKVDLYLQPMGDEFQGEYTPANAERLPWLTGFTGSAGLGAFWAAPAEGRKHTLFTDGRYTIQAAQQVSTDVAVVNSGEVTLAQWLEQVGGAPVIGFDPWLVSQLQLESWKKSYPSAEWKALTPNPVDALWDDRPAAPVGDVQLQPLELAGESYETKRAALLERVRYHHADGVLLALPDGVNWLLNIRGSDIPFNPLLLAYYSLQANGEAILYTTERTFGQAVNEYLASARIAVQPLAALWAGSQLLAVSGAKLLIDPATAAHGFWQLAEKQGVELVRVDDPTLMPKACKNTVELDGIRAAHRRDGVALSRFLCWLDRAVQGKRLPNELEIVDVLENFRKADPSYRGPSFATIAGAGEHGAIVHYRADGKSNRPLRKGELFLLDSGGQYPDGTTDVTRTVAIGVPSTLQKEHFTRVLKGHIALATAIFPFGTSGQQLDILARQYLWQAGLDYDHGTGHGVGAYLCVHEGPARIAKKGSGVPLQPGMVLSNEPGYYAEGAYGIRIENLVTVVVLGEGDRGRQMLGFETLTLAPIDIRLVEVKLLTSEERNWLNAYHRQVYRTHEPHLNAEERDWLSAATKAV